MRTRTPAALAIVAALAFTACGSDDDSSDAAATSPATTEAMADDEMSDTSTPDDAMADERMSENMSEDEMAAAGVDLTVIASERDDLSTLVAAIEAAGLLETLQGDGPFVSIAGNELPVTVDGDTITIGDAEIVEADIFATNGAIHVIDTVLAPN